MQLCFVFFQLTDQELSCTQCHGLTQLLYYLQIAGVQELARRLQPAYATWDQSKAGSLLQRVFQRVCPSVIAQANGTHTCIKTKNVSF